MDLKIRVNCVFLCAGIWERIREYSHIKCKMNSFCMLKANDIDQMANVCVQSYVCNPEFDTWHCIVPGISECD